MVIYTRRGDKGKTSLFDPYSSSRIRISKNSTKVKTLGAIDELNSSLGIVVSFSEDPELKLTIRQIQNDLLRVGAIIAGAKLTFSYTKVTMLEKLIDNLEAKLPVLKNFIIPGGSKSAAFLQFARSLARRAERRIVALNHVEKIKPSILSYMNRLSDFLFMLAREENFKMNIDDEIWLKKS